MGEIGGVKGMLPLGCLPLWEREGVTLTTTEDFQTTQKLRISTELFLLKNFLLGQGHTVRFF